MSSSLISRTENGFITEAVFLFPIEYPVQPQELGSVPPDAVQPEIFRVGTIGAIINHKGKNPAGRLLETGQGAQKGLGLGQGKLV